jgi:hypothetical protein
MAVLTNARKEGKQMKNNYRILITLLGILILIPALTGGLPNTGGIPPGGTGNTSQEIISIDPISSHCVNDSFPLSGNTSLPANTSLRITIRRGSFSPGIPPQQNPWYDTISQGTTVTPGDESGNKWTYTLNTTGSYPDEYLVYVEPYSSENIRAVAIFVLNAPCISGTFPEETLKTISPTGNAIPVSVIITRASKPAPLPTCIPVLVLVFAVAIMGIIRKQR